MQNDSHRRRCDGFHEHQADGSSSCIGCAGVSKYLRHLGASDTFANQPRELRRSSATVNRSLRSRPLCTPLLR